MFERRLLDDACGDQGAVHDHHIVGAAHQDDPAVRLDAGEVAGIQEAGVVGGVPGAGIAVRHHGPARLQPSDHRPVVAQRPSGGVGDLELEPEGRPQLRGGRIEHRPQGRGLRQPPPGADLDAETGAPGLGQAGGTRGPDRHRALQAIGPAAFLAISGVQSLQLRRRADHQADRLSVDEGAKRGHVGAGAGQHQPGAGHRRGEGQAPGGGPPERRQGEHGLAAGEVEAVGTQGQKGLQHAGAVGPDHALGVLARSDRMQQDGRLGLVGGAPDPAGAGLLGEIILGDHALQPGLQGLAGTRHGDDPLQPRQLQQGRVQRRQQHRIDEGQLVAALAQAGRQPLGGSVRIQGMADRADAGDGVPGLDLADGVGADHRDHVAAADARCGQGPRQPPGALAKGGIGDARLQAIRRGGDDLAVRARRRRVVQDAVDRQRPALHQPLHWNGALPAPPCKPRAAPRQG